MIGKRPPASTCRLPVTRCRWDAMTSCFQLSKQLKQPWPRAEQILQASTEAATTFENSQQEVQSQLERLTQRVPQVAGELARLQNSYASSTFTMHASQNDCEVEPLGSTGAAPPQAADLVFSAHSPAQHVLELLNQVQAEFQQGNVLHATDLQNESSQILAYSHDMLDQVEEHLAAIEKQSRRTKGSLQIC